MYTSLHLDPDQTPAEWVVRVRNITQRLIHQGYAYMSESHHQTNLLIHSLPRTPIWDRVRDKYRGCVGLTTRVPNPFFMIEGRWIPTVDYLADQLVLDYRFCERMFHQTQLPPERDIPEVDPDTGLPVPLPAPEPVPSPLPFVPPVVPFEQPESSRARAGTSRQSDPEPESDDSEDVPLVFFVGDGEDDPLFDTEPEVESDSDDDAEADADIEPEYLSPEDEAEEDPELGDPEPEAGETQVAPETQTAEATASDSDDCVITHVHPPKRRRTTLTIEGRGPE
jgi:hypothetical protein